MSQLANQVRMARTLPPPSVAREIRKAAGVSQVRLAAELGVHRMTVAKWESGERNPRGSLRAAYAGLLADLQEASNV